MSASGTRVFGVKIGVDPKILVGGLIAFAAILFWYNSRSEDVPSAPTRPSTAARSDTPAFAPPPAALPAASKSRASTTRRSTSQAATDRGTLRLRPVDATRGDIDPTLHLDLLSRLRAVEQVPSTRSLFEIQVAPPTASAAVIKGPVIMPKPLPAPAPVAASSIPPPPDGERTVAILRFRSPGRGRENEFRLVSRRGQRPGRVRGASGQTTFPDRRTHAHERPGGGCSVAPGPNSAGRSGSHAMTVSTRKVVGARRSGNAERGSALLIVLVFAAIIAINLYMELPVVAFEAERQKEQLLIDRGSEYAHGIKLFVRKTGQYPPSLDALENTNRMRFLRRRFKDPFTGKDDWRLLHSGPGGLIIDSKVNPINPNGANGTNANTNTGVPNGNSPGNTGFGSTNGSNSAFGGFNNNGSTNNSGFAGGFNSGPSANNAVANNNAGTAAPNPQSSGGFGGSNSGSGSGNGGFGGYLSSVNANNNTDSGNPRTPSGAFMRQRAAAMSANGNANGNSGSFAATSNTMATSTADPSFNPGMPNNSSPNANSQNGPATQMGLGQNAGANPATMNNQGGAFSNRTGPGVNTSGGFGTPASSSSGLGAMQGGMIAGVASKAEGTSIKTVNDQNRYQLWEFVYDASKDSAKQMAGALNQTGAAAGANPGNTGFSQGAGANANSAFGNSSFGGQSNTGFGNNSNTSSGGFGNSNRGFGNSQQWLRKFQQRLRKLEQRLWEFEQWLRKFEQWLRQLE